MVTQGAVVLLHGELDPAEVAEGLLERFRAALEDGTAPEGAGPPREAPPTDDSVFGGPGVLVPFDFGDGPAGEVLLDVVDTPWPDHMGDPVGDPMLFGAWSMGQLGPFTFPGALARALEHSYGWPEAPDRVAGSTGFVRLRTSYVFGRPPGSDEPAVPVGVEPVDELLFVTRLAREVLALEQSLAWFCPGGEVLAPAAAVDELLGQDDGPPLELWANLRFEQQPAGLDGWSLMDSVGMAQLDVRDHACAFPVGGDPDEVAGFLRNLAFYVLEHGDGVIGPGDTVDGPVVEGDETWRAVHVEESLLAPPRPLVRWVPAHLAVPATLAG